MPEGGALTPYDNSRAQQEEERLPLLSWQGLSQRETVTTQPMESHGPSNFLFPSIKKFSCQFLQGTCKGSLWLQPQTAILC